MLSNLMETFHGAMLRGALRYQFVIFMVFVSAAPVSAIDRPLAALMPTNTIAYLSTPDAELLDRKWEDTGLARFWQSEDMRAFRASAYDAIRLTPEVELPLWGLRWEQIVTVASGEVCWSAVSAEGEDFGFLLLLDVSHREEQTSAMLEEMVDRFQHVPSVEHTRVSILGHDVDVFRIQTEGEQGSTERFYFHQEGLLGVTDQEQLVQHVLQSREDAPGGLAESMPFQAVRRSTTSAIADSPEHMTWFIDPWAVQSLWGSLFGFATEETIDRLQHEGFDVLQGVGGVLTFAADMYDVEHHWFAYAPGPRNQAARMLDFSPLAELPLPDWIPGSIDAVRGVGWNLEPALPGYGSWFDATWAEGIVGTFEGVLDDIREEEDGPQVDIPALLKLQQGPLLIISDTLETAADQQSGFVYVVRLSDESVWSDAVRRMLEPDPSIRRSSLGEHTAWVFVEPEEGAAETFGPNLDGIAVSVAHGCLLIATSEALLESLLSQRPAATLIEDDDYLELHKLSTNELPQHCISWQVSLVAAGLAPLYETLRAQDFVVIEGAEAQSSQSRVAARNETTELPLGRTLDVSQLPPVNVLASFVAAGFQFVSEHESGWNFSGYMLRPTK